jgi:hypothetical protein
MEVGAVTVTIPARSAEWPMFKVGEKVRLKKSNYTLFRKRLKPHFAVARMKKKPFVPYFRISYVGSNPGQYNLHLVPGNF